MKLESECPICGNNEITITYSGKIRDGQVGNYTESSIDLYKCGKCKVIWHNYLIPQMDEYYESDKYRRHMKEQAKAEVFYKRHDYETEQKLLYTGTEIFRNKIVADVGCGAGAFLDFVLGSSSECIAIEPTASYHSTLRSKGMKVYSYAKEAAIDFRNKIDVMMSFDVIEHVQDPKLFLREIYDLTSDGGKVITGTPTDAPIMRKLLGDTYNEFLFSTQHPWVLSEEALKKMAKEIGFKKIQIKYYQRYGLDNAMLWLKNKEPNGYKSSIDFVSNLLNDVWKREIERQKLGDYIVMYCEK